MAFALLVALARRGASVLVPRLRRSRATPFPPAMRRAYGTPSVAPRATADVAASTMRTTAQRERLGRLMVAGGLGWFASGIVLMHGLGVVPAGIGESTLLDVIFHGSGPMAASLGLLVRAPSIRRPATMGRTA